MREVLIKTRLPPITKENFVDLLNTDELFCDYFNAFLRLPSFITPLVYNRKTGLFEVLTDAPKELARKIKRYVIAEHRNRRRPLFDSVGRSGSRKSEQRESSEDQPPFDICFAVETLDREGGMDWILQKRLPLFVESEVCMEYYLASLMAQVEEVVEDGDDLVKMKIDFPTAMEEIEEKKIMDVVPAEVDPLEAIMMQAKKIVTDTMKFSVNIVSALDIRPEDARSDRDETETEEAEYEDRDTSLSLSDSAEYEERVGFSASDSAEGQDYSTSEEEQEIDSERDKKEKDVNVLREEIASGYLEVRSFEIEGRPGEVTVGQFKEMVNDMQRSKEKKVLFTRLGEGRGFDSEEETEDSRKLKKREDTEETKEQPRTKRDTDAEGVEITSCLENRGEGQLDVKKDSEECLCVMRDISRDDLFDDNISMTDNGSLRSLEPKSYALKSLKGVEQFKTSLCGLPGEKRWNLWMDIERAKLIKDQRLIDRHISCMKDRYVRNGGSFELALETREELGLQDPNNWRMDKLLSVQDKLIEPLLLYWVPAFLVQRKLESRVKTFCALEELRRLDPPPESYPHQRTLPPLPFRPSDCLPAPLRSLSLSSEENVSSVDRSDTLEPSGTSLLHEQSIPEDDILLTPHTTTRRKFSLPERRWSMQVNRRRHWRELLEEQEAGWIGKSPPPIVFKPSVLRRLPSLGEINETEIRKEVTLGQRAIPQILAAVRKTNAASLEMDSSSEFCGGERMEGLLQALDSDNEAGAFFEKELEKNGNQLWLNALMLWKDLQAYHEEFFRSSGDLTLVEKKAKQMFSEFISSSAPYSVQCTKAVRVSIYNGLAHPTDELFDEVEKYALTLLYAAWMHVIERDLLIFNAIKKMYMYQTLDQGSKYVQYIQKRGLIKKKLQEPVIRGRRKLVYSKTSRDRLPSDLRNITLDDLKRRMSKLMGFKKFLADNFASFDLQCLHDIELYRRIPRADRVKVVAKAMDIKWKYYNEKYLFGPNSPADKDGQNKIVELTGGMQVVEDPNGILTELSIYELEKYVRTRLEEKWLPLYLAELAKKDASRVARVAKKGRMGSRPSSSAVKRAKKAHIKSRLEKKRGKATDRDKKKAQKQLHKEPSYRPGAGLEGPASRDPGSRSPGSRGAGGGAGSWEHTFYSWAFDREKVLNLFPTSKVQAAVAAMSPDY